MHIITSETFAKMWHEGKIKWNRQTFITLPVVANCPRCQQKIILTATTDDKEETELAIMAGDFAVFVPKTATKQEFDFLMEKVILPGLEMFGKHKFKEQPQEEPKETKPE